VTDALGPEVTKVYNFLKPLGLAANQTGQTYDVLVGDPLDRDADFYRVTQGQDRWWNASDSASISSKSFNRYAEWLRLWNVASNKRWVLWQIPVGNSNHLNIHNSGGARQGYKDNRPEYFFGTGNNAHLEKFANAGVIAMLFGRGATGQSTHTNDTYTDGKLFMQSRAGAFLKAGGLPFGSGGGTTTPPADPAQYNFESSTQSWQSTGAFIGAPSSSATAAFAGARSLAVPFSSASTGTQGVYVRTPSVPAGRTVQFRIWLPSNSTIRAVQPYVLQGAAGGWRWTGNYQQTSALSRGQWNTLNVTVPSNATALDELGVEFTIDAPYSGAAFVDSVSW
jgi:hypothetical protein